MSREWHTGPQDSLIARFPVLVFCMPPLGIRSDVGRMPYSPLKAAGTRIDPPISVEGAMGLPLNAIRAAYPRTAAGAQVPVVRVCSAALAIVPAWPSTSWESYLVNILALLQPYQPHILLLRTFKATGTPCNGPFNFPPLSSASSSSFACWRPSSKNQSVRQLTYCPG